MKKNVSGQKIGAQMVSAADGSAFSGSVTVYVTGDAGTQALGSVGSGVCTHEGNGFHTYAPAQAETNYDHIGFTFIGSGAIPSTVQVYPAFPQTGDSFARLGAPAGASVSADVAALAGFVDTEVAAIKAKTDNLPASPAAVGDIPTAEENADALLNRDMGDVSDTNSRTPLNALRHIRNKWDTTSNPGYVTVRKEDDTTEAWRAALSTDAGAEPITGSDPT